MSTMSPSVDLSTSYSHYREHLLPIWSRLPEELRGIDWGDQPSRRRDRIHLVAGYADIERNLHNKFIYVEHGAGQQYVNLARGADAHYSGGRGHQHTLMFLCPNQDVADRWLSRYPNKPAVVVGCPRLDDWHAGRRGNGEPKTVAITFHWDAQFTGVPETQSAFSTYRPVLLDLVQRWTRDGWTVLGHHHPRYPALAEFWRLPEMREAGVQPTPNAADVLDRASVIIADNTSLQAEFMSLGRKVVWLNHPAYRKEVHHGGRFWTWPQRAGVQIDQPESLLQLELAELETATWHPYVDAHGRSLADGHASERASACITTLLGGDVLGAV